MVFTSFNFLIFFPLVAIIYWFSPAKYKVPVLLIASYFFYINVKPVYALLLAGITISTFCFTNLIEKTKTERAKKAYMAINIILILLPLFYFKYFGAINEGMFKLLEQFNLRWPLPQIKLLLPIGISFYTFMAIGYTIDVYNEEIEAEKSIAIVAIFISFFPLILSGPIERAKNMLPQFKAVPKADYTMIKLGLKMMLWGYFMKLVVADRIGIYVNAVTENIKHQNGTTLLVTAILYPFQVYADLGGYSLIAIGTASLLGFKVMQNFKRPFFATSMADLWRRWHISLITWLTDYVFKPITFSLRRYKLMGIITALMITFFISGVWHGASLTFIFWGLLQGVFLSIEALTSRRRILVEQKYGLTKKGWYIFLEICLTIGLFSSSQVFGWAGSVSAAFDVYHKIFCCHGPLFIGDAPSILIYSCLGIFLLLCKDFTDEFMSSKFLLFENKLKAVRMMAYVSVLLLILLIGVFDGGQFIYFKF